jgi:hypothetical protein
LRWHCAAEALTWRELEGELVVRSARTGSTHLLEPFAGGVLRALMAAEAGLSAADIVARVCDGNAPPDKCLAAIEAALAEFQQLGLAEREGP